nr:MAG TPA: hypothetical protein [Crassvirales sp.]
MLIIIINASGLSAIDLAIACADGSCENVVLFILFKNSSISL